MKRDPDLYTRVAEQIASSADPATELLRIAQLESARCTRRRRLWVLCGAAAALLLALGLWTGLSDGPSGEIDHMAEARWALGIIGRRQEDGLTAAEEARLVRGLDSGSSRVRRASLGGLSHFGRHIPVDRLEHMAAGLAETVDLPIEFASADEQELPQALRMRRTSTMRMVTRAIWYHAAREHTYPHVETIERFTLSRDVEVRHNAYRALGNLREYRASPEMRLRIEKDTEKVRGAARKLLQRE